MKFSSMREVFEYSREHFLITGLIFIKWFVVSEQMQAVSNYYIEKYNVSSKSMQI